MPAPVGNALRMEIVQRHEQGETLASISAEMKMSYYTVRKIWRHWYRSGRIEPDYTQARQRGTRTFAALYPAAIALKQAHPRWGAALIILELCKTTAYQQYPSVRTVQRWFREAGLTRAVTVKQVRDKAIQRGQLVHQVWAVDAKEQMQLGDGKWACWLVVTDEASGAILQATVFPPQELDAGRSAGGTA